MKREEQLIQKYGAETIISVLSSFLTPERWLRIQNVVAERTLNIAPVLEHIHDRGNTSAVMRSAEAYGFVNFNIIEREGEKFKTSQRTTAGTDKWLEISKFKNTHDCLTNLKNHGFQIYCTHLDATCSLEEIDYSRPTAIILGNEKDGATQEAVDLSDGRIVIPMYGFAQSFNISVAAAIAFSKIHQIRKNLICDSRQLLEKNSLHEGFYSNNNTSGDLTPEQKQIFYAKYILRSVQSAEEILKANPTL